MYFINLNRYSSIEQMQSLNPIYPLWQLSYTFRLALERSSSAEEAIDTIASLVNEYNSDGQTVKQAFVICGEKQIWLMNVVGKLWAAELLTGIFNSHHLNDRFIFKYCTYDI